MRTGAELLVVAGENQQTIIEQILHKLTSYHPEADVALVEGAYRFAAQAHSHQRRISGEPYITHPLAVASILVDLEVDVETLVAGLLHDVVEDTAVTLEEIEERFGPAVAQLVDGVTKLSRLQFKSREEQQAENLRKMFLAMARDIRVVLIKLADRLHNLRTLQYQNPAKQKEIAQETLEIFAPLAHRLGIYRLKWELEDISFRYLQPDEYYKLAERIAKTRRKREEYIREAKRLLQEKLYRQNIQAEVSGRPKNLYSIYQKMCEQGKDLSEIYDILALRVIVATEPECYATLGIVHTLWKPIPGRFKDYIAVPKSNMYQSLHTTVIGPYGEPLEVQIRTFEMHRRAEYGIAAHWRYKEKSRGDREFDQKLAWLRQLLEWHQELRDAREFVETLKVDLFSDVVFVFTPKGDVIELPAGSVPIDLAYRIHTQIGHRCIGAKVNGRIVPLDYKLQNGDIVEIITSKQGRPSLDWLNIVKTSQARNRIRQWFKREKREENIAKGRELLEKELRKQHLEPELSKHEKLLEYGRKHNLFTLEDVYAAVGAGVLNATALISRLRDDLGLARREQGEDQNKRPGRRSSGRRNIYGIAVKGVDNLLVRLAHCCNPVPGDPIIGYVTRGRGVSVHRSDCRNLTFLGQEQERIVEVSWEQNCQCPFHVRLEIHGLDRAGLLSDVMAVLLDMKINAQQVNARGRRNRLAVIELGLELSSKEQLELLCTRLGRVRDVFEVRRVN